MVVKLSVCRVRALKSSYFTENFEERCLKIEPVTLFSPFNLLFWTFYLKRTW